jgi:hypothetical protein
MKINREELYKLYMKEVQEICDECDWVTHIGPAEIVNIISGLLEKNPDLIDLSTRSS